LRGAAAEVGAQVDRVFLWVPVAFGLGAALYLGLKTEPLLWPAVTAALVLGLWPARRRGAAPIAP
jgi:competence protein ComEC